MTSAEGGCLCSAVRYRVGGTPSYSIVCHCNTCRKACGAPSVAWLTFARHEFQLLRGTPRAFNSSPGVLRKFCETCGTALTFESERYPASIDVTTASMDDAGLFPPTREVWLEHKIVWEAPNSQLAAYPKGSE